jgi:hypothetical protein
MGVVAQAPPLPKSYLHPCIYVRFRPIPGCQERWPSVRKLHSAPEYRKEIAIDAIIIICSCTQRQIGQPVIQLAEKQSKQHYNIIIMDVLSGVSNA